MIKKRLVLCVLTIIMSYLGIYAQPRSENEALQIAQEFFGQSARARGAAPTSSQLTLVSPAEVYQLIHPETFITRGGTPNLGFYIFNDEQNKKFVIVSGDERQEDVLGYSESETFSSEEIPCCQAFMLGEYNREFEYLSEKKLSKSDAETESASVRRKATAYTSCILQTKWGQHSPYNNSCNGNVAGCVAIAMGQIMYYHKYPSSYSWSNMLKSYTSNYTTTQANAVAKLIKDCGTYVNMKYGVESSGAKDLDAAWALAHKFGYNSNIKYYIRNYYSQSEWEEIILNELASKRPILYGGDNGKTGNDRSGHAFVLDGYDGNGFFHFNWGWYGDGVNPNYGNGNQSYFKLTSLKPKEGNTTHDFSYNQDMVFQISPQTIGNFECVFYSDNFIASNFSLGNSFKISFKSLECEVTSANSFDTKFNGCIGIHILDAYTGKGYVWYDNISINSCTYYTTKEFTFNTSKNDLPDGIYYIYPCAFNGISNGQAQNITHIRTLNNQYDWYLAEVKNGYVTLTLKGTPPSNPTKPNIYLKSVSCLNSNPLSIDMEKDYLRLRATFKNDGTAHEFKSTIAIYEKNNRMKILWSGNPITKTISGNSELTVEYQYPLTYTIEGEYDATVIYEDDWSDEPGWKRSPDESCYIPIKITYTSTPQLTLSASPSSGEVASGTVVKLTVSSSGTTVTGAEIYYTLNGTTPTKNSTKYTSSGITINSACTLKAIAYKSGYENSSVLTQNYTIKTSSAPNISIVSVTCSNTNPNSLTQNDKLILNATFKNTGAAHTLKSRLSICTRTSSGGLTDKYNGTLISKEISQNGEVTIQYEYSLANVSPGAYIATVIYRKDWGDNDRWTYSQNQSDLYDITVNETKENEAGTGLSIEPFDIKAGEEKEMLIDLSNPNDKITAVQFDMYLPEGLTVKKSGADLVYDMADRTSWHTLDANEVDGGYRFLLYSSSITAIDGTSGAIIKVTLAATQDMKGKTIALDNILLVSPDEKETKPARYEYVIGTDGIRAITIDNDASAPIYNLRGQRLTAPQKGINIIAGKKVVVK